jgi:hypothetical protein
MKKIFKISLVGYIFSLLLILPLAVSAQGASGTPTTGSNPVLDRLTNIGNEAGFQTDPTKASSPIIIGTVVRAFLGFTGLTFIILMLIAGFKWMSANGNEEEVKKATKTISNAVIGLIVALSAWSIWTFFLEKIILMNN